MISLLSLHFLTMRILLALLLFYLAQSSPWWTVQTSGRNTNLRGVSVKYAQNHFWQTLCHMGIRL